MAESASVEDIIAVLQLGDASGDTGLADELRRKFRVTPGDDLENALRAVPPGEVLAALASAVAPVAAMVRDLYTWLGQLEGVRSTANLSVRVSDSQMRTMDLDPARYQSYEQQIVEEISATEFDPSLLPDDSALFRIHDVHWKPACVDGSIAKSARCRNCRPGVAGEFARLERLLHSAAKALTSIPPDRELRLTADGAASPTAGGDRSFFLENLPRWLPEITTRESRRDECHYASPFVADYLSYGLPDLAGCFREVTAQELRSFFALPYWKARWQVFEIWTLSVVLNSYGTRRWSPVLTGDVWNLKAGSTNPAAIATASLPDGRELRCYYQHQSTPPAPLFPGARDRPEILVTVATASAQTPTPGAETEPVLLALEAKARSDYGPQEMTSAIYPLLEWRPARILGVSYFSCTGTDGLHVQRVGTTVLAVAEALTPGSASATAANKWLGEMWQELARAQITIIAADVSASMPPRKAREQLNVIIRLSLGSSRPPWLETITEADLLFLSTFGGGAPKLTLLTELSSATVTKSGVDLTPGPHSQDLDQAVMAWEMTLQHLPRHLRQVDLHLITDGAWNDTDLAALEQCRLNGARPHIHPVTTPTPTGFRDELSPYVVNY